MKLMTKACEKCGNVIEEGQLVCENCSEQANIDALIMAKPDSTLDHIDVVYNNLTDKEKIGAAVKMADQLDDFVTSHKAGGSFENSSEVIERKLKLETEKKNREKKELRNWIIAISLVILTGVLIIIASKDYFSRIESSCEPEYFDGWVYYANTGDNNKLYKVKMDGSEKTLLNNLSVDNFKIYQNNNGKTEILFSAPGFGIYKLNEGGGSELLIQSGARYIYPLAIGFYYIPDFNGERILSFYDFEKKTSEKLSSIYSDNLIYTAYGILLRDLGKENYIWLNSNGKDIKKLNRKILKFELDKNKLFYIDVEQANNLYSLDYVQDSQLDNKNAKLIVKDECINLKTSDGWIYYTTAKNGSIYRVREDGTKNVMLIVDKVENFAVNNGKLIGFIKNKLVIFDLETKALIKID